MPWPFNRAEPPALLRGDRVDGGEASAASAVGEDHAAAHLGEECVVGAEAHVGAGLDARAALARNDGAACDQLAGNRVEANAPRGRRDDRSRRRRRASRSAAPFGRSRPATPSKGTSTTLPRFFDPRALRSPPTSPASPTPGGAIDAAALANAIYRAAAKARGELRDPADEPPKGSLAAKILECGRRRRGEIE